MRSVLEVIINVLSFPLVLLCKITDVLDKQKTKSNRASKNYDFFIFIRAVCRRRMHKKLDAMMFPEIMVGEPKPVSLYARVLSKEWLTLLKILMKPLVYNKEIFLLLTLQT
ncbi:uncharacterized protein LOC143246015 [Tachypleus tridentatus]|uniref:uncharacterized protein LOC143246015 n=1 Tax=Tachypleus tridentatus TaxID=6853 RepID=UPI003FD55C89